MKKAMKVIGVAAVVVAVVDLGAIYDYLRTLPPIKNAVNAFPEGT